jgi:hypothetical protein
MLEHLTRRELWPLAAAVTAGAWPQLSLAQAPASAPTPAAPAWPTFPRATSEEVTEMVGVCHFDLERAKALVEHRPTLVNAVVDWGFGDWETALGAASHTGRRPIAEFLIAHGARPDLFTAAMMGWLDVVRAAVAASPGVQRIRGPHGISLLRHALAGGEAAAGVVAYLESLGDAGGGAEPLRVDQAGQAAIEGEFAFGPDPAQRFAIVVNRQGMVDLKPAGGSGRRLFAVAEDEFHPAGAPAVRVRFLREAGRLMTVEVTESGVTLVARRVGE